MVRKDDPAWAGVSVALGVSILVFLALVEWMMILHLPTSVSSIGFPVTLAVMMRYMRDALGAAALAEESQ